jgi:pyrroline-5-carboxylate reductase
MTMSSDVALSGTLVLLGAGKMGGAMLQGWLDRGVPPAQIVVLDPLSSPRDRAGHRGTRHQAQSGTR